MATTALADADGFNKVWGVLIGAGVTVAVAALTTLVTTVMQLVSANRQRRHELQMAAEESADAARQEAERLALADITSQRRANANVAKMRQVWINDLRRDTACYLALWQEIAFRWAAMISPADARAIDSVTLDSLNAPIAEMRKEAFELRLRIEMRFNPNEVAHQELRQLMIELETLVSCFHRDKSELPALEILKKVEAAIHKSVNKQQEILKSEWNVVKSELGLKFSTRAS
ncbi:hypothetical protein [Variovorax sp. CY25R-8]|uniref:hypothetical protein n=1 Tax=Variovorax sp. CY25R-8 TaxID=2855501 RepID=UPI0021BA6AD7|nr:hypothetical protein [Variovorax sp. CY25R-8]MCT8178900.1 hypothetical protein [Variovorax sp. CY25R-8]